MPAKTTKRATASRPRSTATKSRQVTSSKVNKKRVFIIVSVIAIIGAFFIFRASAATTNFEAEAGTFNSQVVIGTDSAASGGKYAQYVNPSSSTGGSSTITARFPGDPNPLVTGKAYFGATVNTPETGRSVARHETPAGKSLSLKRNFYGWNNSGMISDAKADIAANRLPFYSAKPPGTWANVASGAQDAGIDAMLKGLDSAGGPVWFALQHEPEDNSRGTSATEKCEKTSPESCLGTPAEWLAMQKRVRARMNALGTKNIAFMPILMSWTFDSRSGRNPADWWADGVWDAYIVDHYHNSLTSAVSNDAAWANFAKWAESKKMPFGTGEWGVRSGGAEGVGFWQDHEPGNDCSPLIPRPTTAENEALAKQRHQEFWDWGFVNKKDVIVHAYFDTCYNSGASSWNLGGTQLATFQDILKNDGRVKRIKDPVTQTAALPTNYGTITSTVTLPENGNYKLWARISAPDSTNNSLQAQIDNGAIVNLGDAAIPANTWTWVDYKNGDVNNKTTFSLSAGTRKITLTSLEKGVKLDRVILTNETCVPTGTGDLCALATPPPLEALKVSVTGVSNGQTVSGIVPVKVTADRAIAAVSFRPDNVWAATDDTSPYEFNWDTRSLSNGAHTLVLRTRADGDPGDVYTQTVLNVTVNNVTTVTPPPAPVDSTKPSAPQSLRANLTFDWAKMKYVMNLTWSGSYDNVAVTSYNISRNGAKLGTSTKTSYTDTTNLSASTVYTYSITARDAAGNISDPASITLKTKCEFIACSATVQ